MSSVIDFYTELYQKNARAYGSSPAPIVRVAAGVELPGDCVVELGAGQGRNSLFLAQEGKKVTAVDITSAGLEQLQQRAIQHNLSLQTRCTDVTRMRPRKTYDMLVSTFMLHHFSPARVQQLIQKWQSWISPGGVHVIATFARESRLGSMKHHRDSFFPKEVDELTSLYATWDIFATMTHQARSYGARTYSGKNMAHCIIARRPA